MSRNESNFHSRTGDEASYSANPYSHAMGSQREPEIPFQGDPEMEKLRGSFWKRAGQLQSMIGSWTGMGSWESSGNSTEAWAEQVYRQAEDKSRAGVPSQVHGEYNRLMGTLETAIGHIAGDPEMEAKARFRVRESEEELERYKAENS
ncbi:hypothetical protein EC973_007938 [Apophysomyces ossiformis]|uniref:Uncharacterized protein n=1 Tax=Apophysomyces ossiformis TaxID=679940 RepID=A0A8H7EQM7_9FUNG|nr:hypothetical protein EC973_007938 [Apophysomyces ossiformis]